MSLRVWPTLLAGPARIAEWAMRLGELSAIWRLKRRFPGCGFFGRCQIGGIEHLSMGEGSNLKNAQIDARGGVSIGRFVHTGTGLTVFSTDHDYKSGTHIPYAPERLHKPVLIGDAVWIGANVSILPGVSIGEGAIVGMGAVVVSDVPKCAVVIGNPAKIVGFRDEARYEKLKREELYF